MDRNGTDRANVTPKLTDTCKNNSVCVCVCVCVCILSRVTTLQALETTW